MFLGRNASKQSNIRSDVNNETTNNDQAPMKKLSTSSKPTSIDLQGTEIHFPFKPYDCQLEYMSKVIGALNRSENALLESPTGTGKTLCLLCSTLAWQEQQKRLSNESSKIAVDTIIDGESQPVHNSVPTIIYASRTHSQLSQVVKEMRFTRYRPKHAVLGSREQMCVHPKVKTTKATSSDIDHNCTRLNKERKCRFRNNLDGFMVNGPEENGLQPVLDIEELVDLGKKRKVCPFYLTRNQIASAEILFLPYNYLFSKDARSSTLAEVNWANSIIVFDEAHNLESFAAESASFDLSSVDIAGCMNEVQRAIGYLQAMPTDGGEVKMENLIRLKSIFLQFEQYLDNGVPQNGGSFSGEMIFDVFMKAANINHANHSVFLKFIKQVCDMVMEMRGGTASANASSGTPKLDHFVSCVKRIFGGNTEGQNIARARAYRVHISPKVANKGGFGGNKNDGNKGRVLSFWCFAPSLAMHELQALNVRSILVTSGTLSPLPSYSLELGINFPHTLENSHIITKEQINVKVIGKGVSGKALNSSYNRRDNVEYIMELGNTIISLARIVPDGMLIFFPSYSVMETCIERWGGPLSSSSRNKSKGKQSFFQAKQQRSTGSNNRYSFPSSALPSNSSSTNPWHRLLAIKSIVLEPRTTAQLKDAIDEFQKFLTMPKSKGCILMGVCRGKISEGIDFKDEACRCVVITGIPFAPYLDPKVKLKREYLDSVKTALAMKSDGEGGFGADSLSTQSLSGADWYSQQAHRSVNQAVGRVIRHQNDYGAIVFLDSRYSEPRNQAGVSKWIKPSFEEDKGFGSAIRSLALFFKQAKINDEKHKRLTAAKGPLVIQYEDETQSNQRSSLDPAVKNVAYVNTNTISKTQGTEGDALQGYIPPNMIQRGSSLEQSEELKTLNTNAILNQANDTKQSGKGLSSLYSNTSRSRVGKVDGGRSNSISSTIQSAWSNSTSKSTSRSKPNTSTERNDKQNQAQNVFKTAKSILSKDDLQQMRKLLVLIKKSCDDNDEKSFTSNTQSLISTILSYNSTESGVEGEPYKLLIALLDLLPEQKRIEFEKKVTLLALKQSPLFGIVKESISSKADRHILANLIPELMMNRAQSSNVQNIKRVMDAFFKNNTVNFESHLSALLPKRARNVVRVIIEEAQTKEQIQRLKEKDKCNQQDLTTAKLMKTSSSPTDHVSNPRENIDEKDEKLDESQKVIQSQALKPTQMISQRPSKRARMIANRTETVKRKDPLESLVRQAGEEVFRKDKSRINDFESNAPKETECNICQKTCNQFYIAECNHFSCKECWTNWLARNDNCPTCRQPASIETLSKVLFEKSKE